jgi:hypothetical protein
MSYACDRRIDGIVCTGALAVAAPSLHELPVELHFAARSRHVAWFRCRACDQIYSGLRGIKPRRLYLD